MQRSNRPFARLSLVPLLAVAMALLSACLGGATDGERVGVVQQAAPNPNPSGCPALPVNPTKGTGDPFERLESVGAIPGESSVSASGSFNYALPIWTPAGREGLQPAISLQYDSQSGVGEAGRGWFLSGQSQIHRCGQNFERDGIVREVRLDGGDHFCLDGKKLVEVEPQALPETLMVPSGTLVAEYRTEHESFARILAYERFSSSIDDLAEWVVIDRSGLFHYYGTERGSSVQGVPYGGGALMTLAWKRHRTADRHGNLVDYHYMKPLAQSDAKLLAMVEWGHASSGLYANATRRRIEFHYTNDPTSKTKWVHGLNVVQEQDVSARVS